MSNSDKAVWQQGAGDGFCGLYALANFLRYTDAFEGEKNKPKDVLFCLLEVTESLGLLTSHYFRHGFAEYHLKKIADAVFVEHGLPFRAEMLRTFKLHEAGIDPFVDIKEAIADGRAAIVDWGNSDHWVLARAVVQGSLEVWDSDDDSPKRRLTSKQIADLGRPNGTIIVKALEE